MQCSATAAAWFSIFLEKALVNLVKRRTCIRIVRFWRSANDVLTCLGRQRTYAVARSRRCDAALGGYHRVLRVARTLADLDGADKVSRVHLAEALSYRALADEVR